MQRKYHIFLSGASTRFRTGLLAAGMLVVLLFSHSIMAQTFPVTQCAAARYGADLGCTAGDVSITNMRVVGDTTSCTGGVPVTLDLELTVNFATPDRWDAGIFISNDGKSPQLLPAGGGAASCSVSVLPNTSPFLNLDPNGGTDTCGDGNGSIGGGTGSGVHYMPGTTVACQSFAGAGGKLFIPFVVSWDNQASPSGSTCASNANPVPNTKSKCNAPTVVQGTVSVVVLPTITNTDGVTFVHSGDAVTYTVVIRNTTGVTLSGAIFTDPAVTNINVSGLSCSAAGGASCPAVTVAAMQGAGITIPDMPANSSVIFTINATMAGAPPNTLTNTAGVTVNSQTKSASDTDTVVGTIAIIPSNLSKYGTATPPTLMVFNYTLYNFGASSDTINLSALSNQGWTVQIRNAADTGTISSLTVPAGGSVNFIVKAQVPGGAILGTVDVTTITAISGNDPSKIATATAVTTVSGPLIITPDNIGSGGKGTAVTYHHRVQNNTAANQAVNFATALPGASCAGWISGVYKANGVNPIPPATVILPPFGGFEDIVVRVNIPAGVATGATCTMTVTATAGGNSAAAVDVTTVSALVLYSDPNFLNESYLFPAGNRVYARAFGTLTTTNYHFTWIDPSGAARRNSPNWPGAVILPDAYDIPAGGPLGTWLVQVWTSGGALVSSVNFYVGPDHVSASYTGANPVNTTTNVTIDLSLHDRNHVVPFSAGNLVRGAPPTTQDPLLITVRVNGAASIVSTTLGGAVIVGQLVTGLLSNITGTATITITSGANGTVTVTPASYNAALYGSPARDEPATVTFVTRRMRILYWREMVN